MSDDADPCVRDLLAAYEVVAGMVRSVEVGDSFELMDELLATLTPEQRDAVLRYAVGQLIEMAEAGGKLPA